MAGGFYSDDDAGVPSAPPYPSSDEELDSDDEVIAPQWVQRMYGPPPVPLRVQYSMPPPQQHTGLTPESAAVWGGADPIIPAPGGAYIYHPGGIVPPSPYEIHAYSPNGGAMAVPSGAAVRRARSPAVHPYDAGYNHLTTPRPQPFAGSPTKTPLFEGGGGGDAADADDIDDIERGHTAAGEVPLALATDREEFCNVTMPARNIAMRERRKKQLRTSDKDSFGVPLPNTRRPFSLFASPFSIAEVCTGLGVYLASLQATVLLALMLSLVCIYPLVDNVKNQRWASEYSLLTGVGEAAVSCPKGWDLTSWLTATTIGGHCNSGSYTSKYDCAAQCVWSPDQLNQAQCTGVKPPGIEMAYGNNTTTELYKTNMSGQCALHLPCVKNRLDPNAPDGPCLCCQMMQDEVATALNPRVAAGQLWTFFIAQLVCMAWMLFLVHTQLKAVHIQGTRVVGASDYSAWISGIAKTRTEDAPLAHWCGQFGPTVSAFNVPSVGDALRVGRLVAALQVRKAEAEALAGSTSCNPLQWVYRLVAVGKQKKLEAELERQQRKLVIYERQESEPTGQGLVTFEFSESANAAIAAFERPPLRKLIDSVSLHLSDTRPRLHGAIVKVERAPEPSDILWEHTHCTGAPAVLRRIWSWALTALIILAGAAIQYGLAIAAEQLREDRMMTQYAAGTGVQWAVNAAAAKTRKLRAVTVISAVVVVTINLTIMLTVRRLSWYERWTTRTSMERWVMLKLSISQLCNAFAAPMLAAYASDNRSGWFSRGGLMEAAFFVQCANALVPPLFHLLGLGDKIKYYILSPFARTQPMLNQLLAPPLFPMAEQHAASVTTLGLALWYMPVLPMSPMIALLGLSISYSANKWIALRRAAAPPNFSGMVTAPLNWLLRLLPLVQLILMKKLYFKDYPTIDPVFYTGLAFWTLFCLAPIRALLGAVRRRRRTNASSGLSYHRLLGGKRLGVGDVYAPLVPKPCSRKFKERVASTFAQLAPAAFETILNGEEVAKFLFGGPDGGIDAFDAKKLAEMGVDAEFAEYVEAGKLQKQQQQQEEQQQQSDKKKTETSQQPHGVRNSLRSSIAAGVHGTLALLWQPQDADHPEDVYLPATERTSQVSGTNGVAAAAGRPHRSGSSTKTAGEDRNSRRRQTSYGSGNNNATAPALPTTPRTDATAAAAAAAFQIPAVRRSQNSTPVRPYPGSTMTRVPSRVNSHPRSPLQQQPPPPGIDAIDNFRPLGSGALPPPGFY